MAWKEGGRGRSYRGGIDIKKEKDREYNKFAIVARRQIWSRKPDVP